MPETCQAGLDILRAMLRVIVSRLNYSQKQKHASLCISMLDEQFNEIIRTIIMYNNIEPNAQYHGLNKCLQFVKSEV
jgi:hypothetical protein